MTILFEINKQHMISKGTNACNAHYHRFIGQKKNTELVAWLLSGWLNRMNIQILFDYCYCIE